MNPEDYTDSLQPVDLAETLAEREESARHNLRQASIQKLQELVHTLFPDGTHASRIIALDPVENRSGHYWHVFVPGLTVGQIYGYRVNGSFAPEQGLRFDPQKVLLDPYGRAIARPANYSRAAASRFGDNCATALKSVVADPSPYDWEGDGSLSRASISPPVMTALL